MSLTTKHYLTFANLLVLGLVVWSGATLGLSIFGHRLESRLNAGKPAEVDRSAAPRQRPAAHYEAIVTSNMFGGEGREAAASGTEPENQTKAQLSSGDLRLRGIVVDPETEYGLAILENAKTQDQDLYRVGERIGDAELVQIGSDTVTLRQGGQLVKLKIFQEETVELPFGKPKTVVEEPSDDEPIAESVGPNRYVLSRQALSEKMSNLNQFISEVRIVPNFKDGQAAGFKIASVRRDSTAYELGLRRGDIISQVNGISVNKPEDLMNLYRQVQQLETVTLDIERGGKPETITYSLR